MFDITNSKNLRIKQTLHASKVRKASKRKRVFTVKIDMSALSKKKFTALNQFFLEAKWIYNFLIDGEVSPFHFSKPFFAVNVHTFNVESGKCDLSESRNLTISSQIKQSIVKQVQQNIINLAKARKAGLKIGGLKYKKEVNCLTLKQFGTTFRIKNKKYLSIQGIGKIKVSGLDQFYNIEDKEIGQAQLIKKPSGFYLKILVYVKKDWKPRNGAIGLDFGIKDSIVTDKGDKFTFSFPLPERIKRQQRELARKTKGGKNYIRQSKKIGKLYEFWANQKEDSANQFVHKLKAYDKVFIQDENLSGWQSTWYGKKISTSNLGRIKSKIKNLETAGVIERFVPTTKLCPVCFKRNNIPLKERTYSCSCGYCEDRDIKAAKTILTLGLAGVKTSEELRSLPVEDLANIFKNFVLEDKLNPMKQEAPML